MCPGIFLPNGLWQAYRYANMIGVSWFRLQIVEEKLVLQVQQLAQTALHWESKAQQALKHGESFDNCVKLIRLSKHSFCPVVKTC